jgi:hypothetical protein
MDNFIAVYKTKNEEVYQYTKRLFELNQIDVRTSCGCFEIYHVVMLCPCGSEECPNGYVIYAMQKDIDKVITIVKANEKAAVDLSPGDRIH